MKIGFKQYRKSNRVDIIFVGKSFKGVINSTIENIDKVGKDKIPSIITEELIKDNIDVNN